MESRHSNRPDQSFAWMTVAALVALKLVGHLYTNAFGPYGFHRDEFLYFAMGEHLRLFGMDFPPLIAILSEAVRGLFGDSLVGIRLAPALAGAVIVAVAALAAREFGGGRFAQGLAAFAVVASVLFLRSANLFQPVVFDQLWWTLALLCLLKLGTSNNPRWWLAFGVATGLGLLTKFSILVLGFATLVALVLTRERKWLATRWSWLAAGIALVIGSPSIFGQIVLGFPVITHMEVLSASQFEQVSAVSFALDQVKMHGGFVIALVGLIALVAGRRWTRYRVVGLTAAVAFIAVLLLRGKSYYVGPIFPILFAAGAVVFEGIRSRLWGPIVRWGTVAVMSIYLVALLPLGLPILEPDSMEDYLESIGLQSAAKTNIGVQERIPQDYADMLNWEEQVQAVARVYHGLPERDRERAVILASNYGEAGAIDFFGPRYGLPKAVAFVGTYWNFGPGDLPGEVVVLLGFGEDVHEWFGSVDDHEIVTHPFAVSEQRDLVVRVGRRPRQTLQQLWPSLSGIH